MNNQVNCNMPLQPHKSETCAVLIACHNRREKTLRCIERLLELETQFCVSLRVFLFDDGSSDGTSEFVEQHFPDIRIFRGDGSFFWNRGMHAVFDGALKEDFSYFLWLNDDTLLNENALDVLFGAALGSKGDQPSCIVVGAISDPTSGLITYGGGRRLNPLLRPFLYQLLSPNGRPQEIDVMNGNVVLIPRAVAKIVGNLDPIFEHGMGDTDYAFRARKLGIKILLSPQYVGVCSRNPTAGTFHDKSASLSTRVRYAFSRKGLPLRSWFAICSRHGGAFWPVHFVWGYLRIILSARK